jgi:PhzF family phenazine biosynthesis protein
MTMRLPLYQVDAFADRLFAGNPAAVVPLETWLPDATMTAIAAENNLAETAFFVPQDDGFGLRWFTPKIEVPLCGHATLASAFVLMTKLEPARTHVRFHTKSGPLEVTRNGELYALDFPSRGLEAAADPDAVAQALGGAPVAVSFSTDRYMALYETADEVRNLKPDMRKLLATKYGRAIATAPGESGLGESGEGEEGCDFVSRFFAPFAGIDEDPVTGSSHCTLVPYWAKRLGKTKLVARQVSARGGTLFCEDAGPRTIMSGRGQLYLEGSIYV